MTLRNLPLRTLLLAATLAIVGAVCAPGAFAADCPETAPDSSASGCIADVLAYPDGFMVGYVLYGGATDTTASIEYGITTAYGSNADLGSVASGSVIHSAKPITGLEPNKTYHYHLTVGDWDSGDREITTRPGTPTNLVRPTIVGSPFPGENLVCDPGSWTPPVSFAFQWEQNDEPILGADGPVHTVAAGELGSSIGCKVTALASPGPTADADPVTIVERPHSQVAQAGANRCVVPAAAGKTLRGTRASLRAAYCSAGKITHAYSNSVKKGRVIRLSAAKGKKLSAGAKVGIVVSKGKRPKRH